MKLFFKIALGLLILFSVLFVVGEYMGLFGELGFRTYFDEMIVTGKSPVYVGGIIAILLALDLFLPLPSSILMTFSGYYCGYNLGFILSLLGALVSAVMGFFLCRFFGARFYRNAAGEDGSEDSSVERLFERYGPWVILLSRGFPMLTEIVSCLAGLSHMKFSTFIVYTFLGTVPFCGVYAWAGSAGHESSWIAVAVALGVPALSVVGWKLLKPYFSGRL